MQRKMCYYRISAVHIRGIISYLKGLTSFYHIQREDGMHISLELYKKLKKGKTEHPCNKDKTRSIALKR